MTKILCKKTHERLAGGYITFKAGEWYELKIIPYYNNPHNLGYYQVKHPDSVGGFVVSKLFLHSRFVTAAEWRDMQINEILND